MLYRQIENISRNRNYFLEGGREDPNKFWSWKVWQQNKKFIRGPKRSKKAEKETKLEDGRSRLTSLRDRKKKKEKWTEFKSSVEFHQEY